MTAQRPNRRWWQLLLGLLWVAGMGGAAGVGGAAGPATAAAAALPTASPPAPPTLTWSAASTPNGPPPLAYASEVYDSDNKTVVLFGGIRSDGTLSNDTWVWNGSTWTDHPGSEIQAAPARQLAAMSFDPKLHQLILFGGQGANGKLLGDTWAWNGASWYQLSNQVFSRSPNARENAAFGYDGSGDLVLFGGTGLANTPPSGSSTTTTPGGTSGASGPVVALGDTWLWTSGGWVPASGKAPPARSGASIAYDADHDDAVLFGGELTPVGEPTPKLLSDTWVWGGTSWTRLAPRTSPQVRDNAAMAGTGLPAAGVVLFGGSGAGGALRDTWLWNGTSWAAEAATGSPSARTGAAAAFDGNTQRLVLFGGVGPGGVILGDTVVLTAHAPVATGPASTPTSKPVAVTTSTTVPAPLSHGRGIKPATTTTTTTVAPGITPPPASAAVAPLSATSYVLHRGARVTLAGSGFSPGAAITVTFHSTPVLVGQTKATSHGAFSLVVAVPRSAAGGVHHFVAVGRGPTGKMTELTATIQVVGVPAPGTLSSSAQRAVLLAAALLIPIATWCFLVTAGWWRRRRIQTT